MKTLANNNNESINGMSQVINILTGETKKIRCHYISHRTDKPVSRVLTLERLNHPALTAAGVTAWAERFNDGVNSFDWLRVSIQLTDKICYTPNCANVGLPDVENYGNLDYYKNQEGAMRVSMNNVDKFFQSIADKPAKMMTGEDWPNMAVIAAYRAAGRDEEADTLTTARDIYNARREAKNEAWSKKYAVQQYYYNSPKPKNFADLTELEKAQYMMETAQECAKEHPELDWNDVLERAAKRLEKAENEEEKAYYYSEYQKLGHQEARPQEWLKKTTNEKRATYYRACVELERLAGDGLPLVVRADGADTEANPWNALEKRVKTARVFHLGDRVKMHYPYQCNEVTGVINRIRFDEGSLSLGGWCTHYDIRFDEEYQRPNNFGGKDTGVGNISPERIELVERAEFCPEPAAEWLQPGEKVAHYLDYGDGTGDWLIGNVTGYELCDDGTVIVIYGEYRTPLKGMVKYQPEMDGKSA